jgi:rubrerythrin
MSERRTLINNTYTDITRTEKAQERDRQVIKELRSLNLGAELSLKKKEELELQIEKREEQLTLLRKKLIDIENGLYDEQLISKPVERVKKIFTKKKPENTELYKNDYSEKYATKDYNYFLKQYYKIDDSLPDYIRENLKDMPNNKGYIWRNCWFMGRKKEETNQPIIMFEKLRGGILRIHEYDTYEHRIFDKVGKERRQLVSKVVRKIKVRGRMRF